MERNAVSRPGADGFLPTATSLKSLRAAVAADREGLYLTNAVKHFHHFARGKRRLHAKPGPGHVRACNPWLRAEIRAVQPELIVCLGATAAAALLGPKVRVTRDHGKSFALPGAEDGPRVTVTLHPSAVLRAPDGERARLRRQLERDLRRALRP